MKHLGINLEAAIKQQLRNHETTMKQPCCNYKAAMNLITNRHGACKNYFFLFIDQRLLMLDCVLSYLAQHNLSKTVHLHYHVFV